jgi:acetyl-CoA carboxylase alpha subunit
MAERLGARIAADLESLQNLPADELVCQRYQKIMAYSTLNFG